MSQLKIPVLCSDPTLPGSSHPAPGGLPQLRLRKHLLPRGGTASCCDASLIVSRLSISLGQQSQPVFPELTCSLKD